MLFDFFMVKFIFILVFGYIIRTVKTYDNLLNWKFLEFFKSILEIFQIGNFRKFSKSEFFEFSKSEFFLNFPN